MTGSGAVPPRGLNSRRPDAENRGMTPPAPLPAPPEPRSPLQATAVVAFAIFTLGTTLYALGVTAWSGQRVASLDVQEGAALPLPGFTLTHAGPRAHEVGPVHLDPAMNPARVLAHVGYQPPMAGPLSCRVTMRDAGGRIVWSENRGFGTYSVSHSTRRSNSTTLEIRTFDVPREGDYTFVVDFGAKAARDVHSVSLEVRRQVASVQAWFVITGAFLALASLVVVLVTSPRMSGEPGRRSLAA